MPGQEKIDPEQGESGQIFPGKNRPIYIFPCSKVINVLVFTKFKSAPEPTKLISLATQQYR